MTETYSQIFIQIVFWVKCSKNEIPQENLQELFEYIAGIIRNKGQKPIIVGGISNHVHVFIGLKPSATVSAIVRDIKNNSTNFINEKHWLTEKFAWQNGFGSFSYSNSQVERVYNYIKNQAEHHRKKTYKEEYIEFLVKFNVKYNAKYLPTQE